MKNSPATTQAEMTENWNEILVGEALVCALLARALYVYPEKTWLQSLIEGDVFTEVPFGAGQEDVEAGLALLREWTGQNRGEFTQAAFDAIESDYMRLFIGPRRVLAPPWESYYLNKDHLLFQKETLQVRNWYRRFDLQVEKLYHEPDDHIGIELSFLAHLAQLAVQALESGDSARFEDLRRAQREFLRTHLSRWVACWAASVQENAQTGFYAGMARLALGVTAALKPLLN